MLRDRIKIEIAGEEAEARRIMGARRPVVVKSNKNGRAIIIRGRDVILAEIITAAEERALAEEAQKKAEAERKTNPRPGREPELRIPQARRSV
jgi:hypothetical protein